MNIQKLECPNCHASLDNDYGNAGVFFCKYCGQKMIVEEIQNADYDLKIRKMEIEHEENKIAMEQKGQSIKYAHEKESKKMQNKFAIIGISICFGVLILLMLMLPITSCISGAPHQKRVNELKQVEIEVQEAIQAGDYDLAMIKVNQLRLDDGYSTSQTEAWDEKREAYIELIEKKMKE